MNAISNCSKISMVVKMLNCIYTMFLFYPVPKEPSTRRFKEERKQFQKCHHTGKHYANHLANTFQGGASCCLLVILASGPYFLLFVGGPWERTRSRLDRVLLQWTTLARHWPHMKERAHASRGESHLYVYLLASFLFLSTMILFSIRPDNEVLHAELKRITPHKNCHWGF